VGIPSITPAGKTMEPPPLPNCGESVRIQRFRRSRSRCRSHTNLRRSGPSPPGGTDPDGVRTFPCWSGASAITGSTGTRKKGRTALRSSTLISATRACRSAFFASGAPVAIVSATRRRTLARALRVMVGVSASRTAYSSSALLVRSSPAWSRDAARVLRTRPPATCPPRTPGGTAPIAASVFANSHSTTASSSSRCRRMTVARSFPAASARSIKSCRW